MNTHALLVTRDTVQRNMLFRGCQLSSQIDDATVVKDGQATLEFLLESIRKTNHHGHSFPAIVDMKCGMAVELLKFLRTTPSCQQIPVVALVSHDDEFMLVNASEADVHAILSRRLMSRT